MQVDDEKFDILLEYLEGLKGKSREETVNEAETLIKTADIDDDEDEEDNDDDDEKEDTEEKSKPAGMFQVITITELILQY